MSPNQMVNPDGLAPATGFSYAAISDGGRLIHLAGITGHAADGSISDDIVTQFGAACDSILTVLAEAGAGPSDLVSMTIYTSDIAEYRDKLREIGGEYRSRFGKHYPPMALFGISELFDPKAVVELVCVAVSSR